MGSKVIVFIGLFLATVLLISSEVAARELSETSNDVTSEETNGAINDPEYNRGGHGGYPGGGYSGGHGGHKGGYGGGYGGGHGGHKGGGGGYGGKCKHGCCGYYKGSCRCCSYAGEKADAEPQN